MAWSNGGGETTEIAVVPSGATFETFDWRLSVAHVAAKGPFSILPAIDRSLVVTRGAGLILASEDLPSITITPDSPPLEFKGESAIQATLVDGPVDDLNVMTRRGRFAHQMRVRPIAGELQLQADGALLIVSLRDCDSLVEWSGGTSSLKAGDFAIVRDRGARLGIRPEAETLLYEISLWPV